MIGSNENILWSGKPNLKCFILETIFNSSLPFAFIWALLDFTIIGIMFTSKEPNSLVSITGIAVLCGFFALHLMPVWIYLGGVLSSCYKYRHTEFVITDRCIYTSTGVFSQTFETVPVEEIRKMTIHRGLIDRWIGVGDIVFSQTQDMAVSPFPISISARNSREKNIQQKNIKISDISDFQYVYELIKDLQTKINQTDS
ncbi:MAG: PH domain-containing protein, partial [Elusimicrobiaceae bacterium]|nr:PH domain-containing protein [Elusimicrobiaceae bacterium]